jgi:DNA adenine methylase
LTDTLKAPFPWFGGKSRAAPIIWPRFGDPANYVEPFAGSLAVLLSRPTEPRLETVNDLDCYIANFWRAVQSDPQAVAHWADWPVNEADLHARHLWLVQRAEFRERMKTDPDFYDVKIAGLWVWGISCWIGGNWCDGEGLQRRKPQLHSGGQGINRTKRERPHLSSSGQGINTESKGDLYEYFDALCARLRRVRVCCGDWSRVVTPAVTVQNGLTAVLLDPPYNLDERDTRLYTNDTPGVAAAAAQWARDNGDDPLLRIALCGYEGEHDMPESWECIAWKTGGGYGNRVACGRGRDNADRERIWFSQHCLRPAPKERQLAFL